MKFVSSAAFFVALFIAGCSQTVRQSKFDDPRCGRAIEKNDAVAMVRHCGLTFGQVATFNRLNASFEIGVLQANYYGIKREVRKHSAGSYPALVAAYVLLNMSAAATGQYYHNPEMPPQGPFPDEVQLRHDEGREYLAFMKSIVAQWARGEISWADADYLITAKGNEFRRRFKEEFAADSRQEELQKQTRALEALRSNRGGPPPLPNFGGQPSRGLSLLCKEAIQRGDQGGIFVHC